MTTEVRDRFLCRGEDGSEHMVIMYQRFTTKVAANNGSHMVI
ncbi:hypothetical protein [uncultured Ruegeria sp.]|nr:hypothetical protein [uncultured Ruegeria sp.]